MRRTVLLALALALATLAAPATTPAATAGPGPGARQVHPSVRPATGTPRTRFTVHFTLTEQPGHQGFLSTEYSVQIDPPSRRSACRPPQPPRVDRGRRGARIGVALPRPRGGWCRGRHRLTVLLVQGPYCPPPETGGEPTVCPLFATRALVAGRASFLVRPQRP